MVGFRVQGLGIGLIGFIGFIGLIGFRVLLLQAEATQALLSAWCEKIPRAPGSTMHRSGVCHAWKLQALNP